MNIRKEHAHGDGPVWCFAENEVVFGCGGDFPGNISSVDELRAEEASRSYASETDVLTLVFEANTPVKFAKIAVSSVPYGKNSVCPSE